MRKFKRDRLRKIYGNKGLSKAWANHQRNKWGRLYYKVCLAIQNRGRGIFK